MAIVISHRGNLHGPRSAAYGENHPKSIAEVLRIRAFRYEMNVEVDVWEKDGLWLGHDTPQYRVEPFMLEDPHIWWHAKNIEALHRLLDLKLHCFFHQTDQCTLTSRGYVWLFPKERPVSSRSIVVLPEIDDSCLSWAAGFCSDYPGRFMQAHG